ncbi:hypothetical protein L211DRAFT_361510 [Terfezia boudieri ATCC MYA-4762]|uniref:Uncharacterized protein n=1 Tax=Terfezia boudieri ATCC MYA-4762 TaxID=1051890 RepID=A0A3N4MHJ9_9PEZI|nr:hypothetical protein L211DRAFT_361510 [Terfezia boudieri ATCC MYA-4762]
MDAQRFILQHIGRGHADVLLEKGANIHSATTQAETALHLVFDVPTTDYWRKLKDSKQLVPTITVLLAHGSNILQKNNRGQTPLDLAEKGGYPDAKYLFLRYIKERNLKVPEAYVGLVVVTCYRCHLLLTSLATDVYISLRYSLYLSP